MDENDLFAELDALSSSAVKANPPTETAATTTSSSSKNIEDELFELLNATSTITPIKSDGDAPVAKSTAVNLSSDEDFLSWLEETPKRTGSNEATQAVASVIAPTSTSKVEDAAATKVESTTSPVVASTPAVIAQTSAPTAHSAPTSTTVTDTSMDAFLNDVLGTDSNDQHHEEIKAIEKKEEEAQRKKSEFEQQLEAIVDSPFPDLGFLRLILDQGGYIPQHLRGKVLILLLTGRTQLDDEASSFTASASDKQFFIDLLPDCEALIQQQEGISGNKQQHVYKNSKSLVEKISDVVYLYCQRRNVEYKNVFSRIMLSILGADEDVPKPLLSSCFYSLAANFLPLVGLQYTSLDLATEAVHFWLRLLVTYHSPALAQHLDRVTPGWEKCARELTTQQVAKYNNLAKGSSKLDQLEKEFGIHMDFDFEENEPQETPKKITTGLVESASPKTQKDALTSARKGLISTHWIISFFAGNIPAEESSKLLDWSVFNGERFAGLYFLTSLLDLHSEILLKMNGHQVTSWFENIERNTENWFKSCQFQYTVSTGSGSTTTGKHEHTNAKETKEFSCKDLTWSQFTNGWIKATANLICNTPQAFRDSLPRTETWAVLAAERQSKALSNQFKNLLSKEKKKMNKNKLDEQLHGVDDPIFDDNESDSASEDSDNEGGAEEEQGNNNNNNNNPQQKSNTVSTLFGQLKAVADRFKGDSALDASFDETDLSFAQDQKLTADTICLWSSVEEVLPCICSNIRRKNDNQSPKILFADTVNHEKNQIQSQSQKDVNPSQSQSQTCFFLAPLDNYSPLYFAIDCRRLAEKTLGLFPKAYSLDPEVIFDGEGLNELLAILEPMTTTTHICIIGSGSEYYKWLLSLQYKKKTKKWKKELKELMDEEFKCLNALAMILIKKSFPYISILQGGFYQAIHYIHKPESKLSLNTALIDIDRYRLSSMLGLTAVEGGGNVSGGNGSNQPSKASIITGSLATALNETAPAAIKSVGNLISNWRQSATAANNSTATATTKPAAATPATTTDANTSANTSGTPASTAPASNSNTEGNTAAAAKQMFSGFGKSLGIFGASSLDTIKKGISAVAEKAATTANASANNGNPKKSEEAVDDHLLDDGMGPKDTQSVDDHKISITKSDQERAQALALHRMSGLKKGDQVTISRAELPGAILFPCTKIKEIWVTANSKSSDEQEKKDVAIEDAFEIGKSTSNEEEAETTATPQNKEGDGEGAAAGEAGKVKKEIVVSRYLVVSRERFMVLDANGGGVGSIASVKSNHHLTELVKMTFRKKDPELVSLFILCNDGNVKTRKYRVTKFQDFINTLQKHMERFK